MLRVARWQCSGKSKQRPARSLARLNPDELRPALEECLKRGDCNFGGTKVCRPHLLRILMAAVKDATPKSIQLGQLVRQSLTFGMLVGLEELLNRTRHSKRCVLAGAEQALPGDHRRQPSLHRRPARAADKGLCKGKFDETVRAARLRRGVPAPRGGGEAESLIDAPCRIASVRPQNDRIGRL